MVPEVTVELFRYFSEVVYSDSYHIYLKFESFIWIIPAATQMELFEIISTS